MTSVLNLLRRWWALTVFIALVCLGMGAVWAATQTPPPNLWNTALVAGALGTAVGVIAAAVLERVVPRRLDVALGLEPSVQPARQASSADQPIAEVAPATPHAQADAAPRISSAELRVARTPVQRRADVVPRVVEPPSRPQA